MIENQTSTMMTQAYVVTHEIPTGIGLGVVGFATRTCCGVCKGMTTTRTPIEIEKKIVAAYRTGKYTQAEVGKKYGVKRQTVHFILHRYPNGVVHPR